MADICVATVIGEETLHLRSFAVASTVAPTPQPLYRRARVHLERFSSFSPEAPRRSFDF